MNYRSISVPVKAVQFAGDNSITEPIVEKYVDFRSKSLDHLFSLKPEYGSTGVDITDWLVEFPNGEIHVVTDKRFKQRFQEVESYTPEEVNNAISMARLLAVMGGETS